VGQRGLVVPLQGLDADEQDAHKQHDALVLRVGQLLERLAVLGEGEAAVLLGEDVDLALVAVHHLVHAADGQHGVPDGRLLEAGLGHHARPEVISREAREGGHHDLVEEF
jgi:hypothetical protein